MRPRAKAEVQGQGWRRVSTQRWVGEGGSRRYVPAKTLRECQGLNWRKSVQVSGPKGRRRAVRWRGPRWPWNGVGAGWAGSKCPAVSAQDFRGASCEDVDGLGQHEGSGPGQTPCT